MIEGHFAPGSMLPKIKAAIDFIESGSKSAIIMQSFVIFVIFVVKRNKLKSCQP
jgi:carbamate kinase